MDIYQALGIPYPDPKTVCDGHCEGTGWVPVKYTPGSCSGLHGLLNVVSCDDEVDPRLIKLWWEAHNKNHKFVYRIKCAWLLKDWSCLWEKCDGWHFVKCPDCNGTGRKK